MAVDTVARTMLAVIRANGGGGGGGSSDITTIQVNNVTVPPVEGVVNIAVPTKLSQLTNDVLFITQSQLEKYLSDNYVPVSVYQELVNRVSALENALNVPNTSVLLVPNEGE